MPVSVCQGSAGLQGCISAVHTWPFLLWEIQYKAKSQSDQRGMVQTVTYEPLFCVMSEDCTSADLKTCRRTIALLFIYFVESKILACFPPTINILSPQGLTSDNWSSSHLFLVNSSGKQRMLHFVMWSFQPRSQSFSFLFVQPAPVWSQVLEIRVRPLKAFPPLLFTLVSVSQHSVLRWFSMHLFF